MSRGEKLKFHSPAVRRSFIVASIFSEHQCVFLRLHHEASPTLPPSLYRLGILKWQTRDVAAKACGHLLLSVDTLHSGFD